MKIQIKPLSVNQAWKGRKFKTAVYKSYELQMLSKLPKNYKIPDGALEINFKWGFSSKLADWDNPIKPMQDILQKKYNFNDSRIFKGIVEKEIVKKGEEYIYFKITKYEK